MWDEMFGIADFEHCFSDYRLSEALGLARMIARRHGDRQPASLDEAYAIIAETRKHAGFHWITGEQALELIEAARTGKPISEVAR